MRIAFASCFCESVLNNQPVWDWIRAKAPDHLVLLGDSIYIDISVQGEHPKDMGDNDFAVHLFKLYTAQLRQPQFASLIQSMPANRVWSIWDDHDFLWNNALGAVERESPIHKSKVRLSTAFQEAFRGTLAQRLAPGSFPSAYNDMAFWDLNQPPLSTPSLELDPGVWLHLTDGRSYRTKASKLTEQASRTLLGAQQREVLGNAMASHPDAIHLVASGSTLGDYKKSYPTDWQWLLSKAALFRTLVLSGDIHRNETGYHPTTGRPLHEATSSGAAIRDAVVLGHARSNFGLLDIDAQKLTVTLFSNNAVDPQPPFVIDRATWQR